MHRTSFLLILLLCATELAVAQTTGIALRFQPSARMSGMGRTGTAVFWGENPSSWGNPALLSRHRGISYSYTDRQLVPDLADDVFFTSHTLTAGWGGIGFESSGHPVGEIVLDQGEQTITDAGGVELGTFDSEQRVEAFAIGFSPIQHGLASGFLTSPWFHTFDVSFGYARRDVILDLVPPDVISGVPGLQSEGTSEDWGVLATIKPIDSFIEGFPTTTGLPASLADFGVRLELGYGIARQGFNDDVVIYDDVDQIDPLANVELSGWSAHLALGRREVLEGTTFEPIADLITPLLQFGWVDEHQAEGVGSGGDRTNEFEVDLSGWEITILDIISMRGGSYEDPTGQIDGDTEGWSVGFQWDGIGGIRYDSATYPQAVDLDDVDVEAWRVNVDVLGLVQRLRERG